jgi:hypothetical protein
MYGMDTVLSSRTQEVRQERGGPPEPNGIVVPEWSLNTST